jgi:aminoglycoside phosphotransferase (APT) family kinase protein
MASSFIAPETRFIIVTKKGTSRELREGANILDIHQITEILESQFSDIVPARVEYLGEGCDNWVVEVNKDWLFRFPKRSQVERQLLIEIGILPKLAAYLPVTIPAFCFQGNPSSRFPYIFVGYRKIHGEVLLQPKSEHAIPESVAKTLALFLSRLHAFPVEEATRLGVRRKDIRMLQEEFRIAALRRFSLLCEVAPSAPLDQWRHYLETGPEPAFESVGPQALLHNDLVAEHILLDSKTRNVAGIIDWGDIAIGDPAADFAGLFHWGGEPFVRSVLSSYAGSVDNCFLPRARYLAACKGVHSVAFGVDTNQGEYVKAGLRALRLTARE